MNEKYYNNIITYTKHVCSHSVCVCVCVCVCICLMFVEICLCVFVGTVLRQLAYFVAAEPGGRVAPNATLDRRVRHG